MHETATAADINDPLNLLAVDGPANEQKRAGDAATWLPPNKAFRCRYVSRQVRVKSAYGLWVTAAERDAIARVLRNCDGPAGEPGQGAPGQDAPGQGIPPPDAAESAPPPDGAPRARSYYRDCDAARAAGAAPIRRGDPGYRPGLDGDDDGFACE